MFGGLRPGNLVYVLDKNEETATLRTAQVESVSNPQPRYGTQMPFGNADMVVDIRVKDGNQSFELKQLSTNMNIANNGTLVVADSREAMTGEVEALMRTSQQTLESIPYHEKIVSQCEVMMRELNPQFAREKEREEKIGALEDKMGSIEGALSKIEAMLASFTGTKAKGE